MKNKVWEALAPDIMDGLNPFKILLRGAIIMVPFACLRSLLRRAGA
jgi:hypothetical protein